MPEFMTEWWFIGLMAALLAGLVVVFLVVRSRKTDD